jgi:putative membrane protein
MNEPEEPNDGMRPIAAPRVAGQPTADSCFAWMRTRLAADSMLMSWMALATTLIGFGFAIVQFFDRFEEMRNVKPALAPRAPHYLGLALILLGAFGLCVAIGKYVALVRFLNSVRFQPFTTMGGNMSVNKSAVAIAVALVAIGATAFVTVLFRLS